MKKIIILLSILLTVFACNKSEVKQIDTNLTGKWALTEVLADPGDGSGTFHPVQSNKILEFHADGTITSNGSICDMSIEANSPSSGTYSLADSTISPADCNYPMKIKFEHSGSLLILYYPCIEPCSMKYEKNK